jgi:hypothetical protein
VIDEVLTFRLLPKLGEKRKEDRKKISPVPRWHRDIRKYFFDVG